MAQETQDESWSAAQLLRVSEITADFRGSRYMQALVMALTRSLQVRFAMVSVRREGVEHAQVLAMADGEDMREPYRYSTENLPCRSVLNGEPVGVPCNVMEFFPGAADLEAYVGYPLRERDGTVAGILAVMDPKPMQRTKEVQRLLRALAGRVAAELEASPEMAGKATTDEPAR